MVKKSSLQILNNVYYDYKYTFLQIKRLKRVFSLYFLVHISVLCDTVKNLFLSPYLVYFKGCITRDDFIRRYFSMAYRYMGASLFSTSRKTSIYLNNVSE